MRKIKFTLYKIVLIIDTLSGFKLVKAFTSGHFPGTIETPLINLNIIQKNNKRIFILFN